MARVDEVSVVKADPVKFDWEVIILDVDCTALLLAVLEVVVAPADAGPVAVALDPLAGDPAFTMLDTISASSAVRLLKKL